MNQPLRRTAPAVALLLIALALTFDGIGGSPAAAQVPPPTVTQITPTSSAAAGGATVTILGTGFATATGATQFTDPGGNPYFANVACISTTQCTALSLPQQVDARSALAIEVVATVGGTIGSDGEQFVWYGRPGLTRLTPSSARAGTLVTLHGGVFPSAGAYGGPVSIHFGGRPATDVACPNIDECYGRAPAGSGTVQVTLTTPGGTSNALSFTYPGLSSAPPPHGNPGAPGIPGLPSLPTLPNLPALPSLPSLLNLPAITPPPIVTGVSPNFGPYTGGTPVTITGTNLQNAGGFIVESGQSFTNVACTSATSCTALSPAIPRPPAGIGAAPLSVSAVLQTAQAIPFFTFYVEPGLHSISPTGGPTAGGTRVTLSGGTFPIGGYFPGPVSVSFGGTPATGVVCHSINTCTATAPPGSGTVQATITTPGGASNGLPYTYNTSTPTLPLPSLPIPPIPPIPALRDLPALPALPGLPAIALSPIVTGVTPNFGPSTGGTPVTITGTGFGAGTGFALIVGQSNAYAYSDVNCSSSTICTARTLAAPIVTRGTAQQAFTVAAMQTAPPASNPFTVYGPTSLEGITPTSGPATGGTRVTLVGGIFPSGSAYPGPMPQVFFGDVAATDVSCPAAEQGTVCFATAPPRSGPLPATVPVTIISVGGTSPQYGFTYSSPP